MLDERGIVPTSLCAERYSQLESAKPLVGECAEAVPSSSEMDEGKGDAGGGPSVLRLHFLQISAFAKMEALAVNILVDWRDVGKEALTLYTSLVISVVSRAGMARNGGRG